MTFWQNVRHLFIEAHPRIVRSEDRRGARLFSILMLLHAGLVIALIFVLDLVWRRVMGATIWGDPDGWVIIGGMVVILVAYALLRCGLYRLSLWVYILTTVVVPLVAPFVPDPNAEIALLATAMIPILLTTMVFSERWVLLVLGLRPPENVR